MTRGVRTLARKILCACCGKESKHPAGIKRTPWRCSSCRDCGPGAAQPAHGTRVHALSGARA